MRIVSLLPSATEIIAGLGLANVAAQTANLARKRVLFIEWTQPLMGAGCWMPAVIEAAGGEVVLASDGGHAPTLDWAQVAAADPDVIIAAPCGFDMARLRQAVAAIADDPRRFDASIWTPYYA